MNTYEEKKDGIFNGEILIGGHARFCMGGR